MFSFPFLQEKYRVDPWVALAALAIYRRAKDYGSKGSFSQIASTTAIKTQVKR